MTKEQEAQQAQTIARIEMEIKLSRATMISHGEARAKKNVVALLEIVDTQAQKIAEQAKEIERLKGLVRKRLSAAKRKLTMV